MSEASAFNPTAYIRAMRRAGMYVEPWHEKRSFFVGNPEGMGKGYSRVCRRFRAAFNADRKQAIKRVYEVLCAEVTSDQRPLNSRPRPALD
jgi:hypothetical protein